MNVLAEKQKYMIEKGITKEEYSKRDFRRNQKVYN